MSSPGALSTVHPDGNGLSTIVTVLEGFKLWVFGRKRTPGMHPLPVPEGDMWWFNLFHDCELYAVVLGPGDTL